MAAISAGSPAPTITARHWRRPQARRAKTWRAYLSTQAADGQPAVNARDRIGKGPWKNAKGAVVAKDVADLHSAGNNLTKQTALSEKGEVINGARRHAEPPRRADGIAGGRHRRLRPARIAPARTGRVRTQGAAMVGHFDRIGLRDDDAIEILELVASLARLGWRLLAGRSEEHRRRRPDVLLRGELTRVDCRCQARSAREASANPGSPR